MFRSALAAGALALVLAGCNVTSSQVAGLIVSAQTLASAAGQAELVAKAQARVIQACGYQPTAQTIAAIAKTFAPSTAVTLDLVDTVATGICAAVQNPNVAYASGRATKKRDGTYRGVPIRGQRVGR